MCSAQKCFTDRTLLSNQFGLKYMSVGVCPQGNRLGKISNLNLQGWSSDTIASSWAFVYFFFIIPSFSSLVRCKAFGSFSELQGKVVDDVKDFDSETDAKIVEGIFLKLNTRKQLVLTTSVEDFWNCAHPSFLLYSVSCSHGLWKKTLYPLLGKPL